MDNVTHSLAGLLLAESAMQLRDARTGTRTSGTFRTAAAIVGVIAGNLPDADLVYAGSVLRMGNLGYLLHHRGHTHTVLLAVVGAVLLWAGALAWWRFVPADDRPPATSSDRRWLLGLALAGTLSHLALDFTNSYGVHPFWPLDDRWFYGDAVFIVEPWLWVVALPPLIFLARRRATGVVLGALLAIIVAAAWAMSLVPRDVAVALTVGAALALGATALLTSPRRVVFGVGAWLVVEAVFFACSHAARANLVGPHVVDAALTPDVADPLCYRALVVEVEDDRYVVSSVALASLPAIASVARCSREHATDVMRASTHASTDAARWETTWTASRTELRALARENCVIAAALRFIRVPMWTRDAAAITMGDARFGRGGGGFAQIVAPITPPACPAHVPSWVPPRADLLGGA